MQYYFPRKPPIKLAHPENRPKGSLLKLPPNAKNERSLCLKQWTGNYSDRKFENVLKCSNLRQDRDFYTDSGLSVVRSRQGRIKKKKSSLSI